MKDLGLQTIPVASIDATDRLRSIDEGYAALLAENFQQVGRMRQPIEVRVAKGGGYKLIAGGHRIQAAQIVGWTEVPAFVYDASDDEARLGEIDENLMRRDLDPLDKAVFLATRKDVYERLYPQTKAGVAGGKARQGSATDILSFAEDTAARCGLNERTIRRLVALTGIDPTVRSRISGTWLARHQSELGALAKQGPEMQARIVDILIDADHAVASVVSVKEALDILNGVRRPEKSADEKKLDGMQAAWTRASGKTRNKFVVWLKERGDLNMYLPAASRQEA